MCERVCGPEDQVTLAVRSHLALFTGQAGDAAGARDQLAPLLPVYERVDGPEHPETLTVRSNLAFWIGEAGDGAGPGTSTRRCCRCMSGCLAANIQSP